MGSDGSAALGKVGQRGQEPLLLAVEEGAEKVEQGGCRAGETRVEVGEAERAISDCGSGLVEIQGVTQIRP